MKNRSIWENSKKIIFFWGGGWSGPVWVGQGGCEQRIEIFRKIKKKKKIFFFFWGGGGVGLVGGQGG